MKPYRREKLNSLIQQELSKILEREIELENTLITVIETKTTKDLKETKIKISVFPDQKKEKAKKIIEDKQKEIEYQLFKKINIKKLPKLIFVY